MKKEYNLDDFEKDKEIDEEQRPKRMKRPPFGTIFPKDRPIDYGDVAEMFIDKYGKERGEQMYEDLFIQRGSNIGWSIARDIQKEKAWLFYHILGDRPSDMRPYSYYKLWKVWESSGFSLEKEQLFYEKRLKKLIIENSNLAIKKSKLINKLLDSLGKKVVGSITFWYSEAGRRLLPEKETLRFCIDINEALKSLPEEIKGTKEEIIEKIYYAIYDLGLNIGFKEKSQYYYKYVDEPRNEGNGIILNLEEGLKEKITEVVEDLSFSS